jgi:hypothetical protein
MQEEYIDRSLNFHPEVIADANFREFVDKAPLIFSFNPKSDTIEQWKNEFNLSLS